MTSRAIVFLVAVAGLALVGFCAGKVLIEPGDATFAGSGCPESSVHVVSSVEVGGALTLSAQFGEYNVSTSNETLRVRETCNVALPIRVPPGVSLGVFQVAISASPVSTMCPAPSAHPLFYFT